MKLWVTLSRKFCILCFGVHSKGIVNLLESVYILALLMTYLFLSLQVRPSERVCSKLLSMAFEAFPIDPYLLF